MTVERDLIYLDNGATSFPKPHVVWEAMEDFIRNSGGSPGRAGHRLSQEASRIVFSCREKIARLFAVPDARRIVFTGNATQALNIALLGLLRKGDRVLVSSMEHNSVMRPLRELARTGKITLESFAADAAGRPDLVSLEEALARKPRLLVVNHASNVTGAVVPMEKTGKLAKNAGALLLVDAAQSAGLVPIDVERDGIDLLAFTGHKGLLGPQGTGGLWIREGVEVSPLYRGGTGSNSEREEQPDFLPDRLESGTQNAVGLAGLLAGVEFIQKTGVETIAAFEKNLFRRLMDGLSSIPGIRMYGPGADEERTAVLSVTFAGMAPSEVGFLLDEMFGVLVRVGLHCAPSAHQSIGTFPSGTIRLSPGFFTTEGQIERVLEGCSYLVEKKSAGNRS